MDKEELKARTKKFALRVINLVNALPKTGNVIGTQLLRSGTSVGANYRAVCSSKSKADFISKLGTVVEETEESAFWLEIIIESYLIKRELVENLLHEAYEILAIIVPSKLTAQRNCPKFQKRKI
jgi:four helix bundle protein